MKSSEDVIKKKKNTLIIGISMYSEDYKLIDETLEGIMKNLPNLNKAGFEDKNILVIIISDGKDKVDKKVSEKFIGNNLSGKEQIIDDYMKKKIFLLKDDKDPKPNYLISCCLKREKLNKYENGENQKLEMDIIFSIKKENKGKLDSHYWLFMGFCKKIDPEYIVLLDTGTIPDPDGDSLCSLILPMNKDKSIAGTCGEMELSNPRKCTNLPLSAQILEYKYAHVIDKYFESLYGFVSVLPGAFSAYRWKALNNNVTLSEYFMTIDSGVADCAMANRYLAEDRIFCWILFSLEDEAYILKYVPEAKAKTDAPEKFAEFILQRRRWINGSNFALFYVLTIYDRVWKTKHRIRQIFILILFIYYFLQSILSYFLLGTFYFIYYIICQKNFQKDSLATSIIMSVYLFIIVFCIIASLAIKPKRENIKDDYGNVIGFFFSGSSTYKILSTILGIYNIVAFFFGIYTIINGGFNNPDKIDCTGLIKCYKSYEKYLGSLFLLATGLGNFIFPLIYNPSMIFTWIMNFIQYICFQPTYVIILNVFSVCNIDDVSWGNRDSNAHLSADTFKKEKIKLLFVWLILNFILGWGFVYIITTPKYIDSELDKDLINSFSYIAAGLGGFKLISAILGKIKWKIIDKRCRGLLSFKKDDSKKFIEPEKKTISKDMNYK